ncbi:MAG TPA: flagellar hook-length control protein FliK [Nitrospirae bacterium]|nr:flagellar hook-length control protein FliK [Nitrospirota bacterium]
MPGSPVEIINRVFTLYPEGRPPVSLSSGEILRARVVSIKDRETLTLALKGSTIRAKSEVALNRGDSIIVKVESRGDQLRLKLLGIDQQEALQTPSVRFFSGPGMEKKTLGELLDLIGRLNKLPPVIKERLPEIEKIVGRFSLSPVSLKGDQLKDLTESSGVLLETRLKHILLGGPQGGPAPEWIGRDMKVLLLQLLDRLNEGDTIKFIRQNSGSVSSIRKTLNELLQNIQYHQLESRINDAVQTYLPLIWPELRDGLLVFRRLKRPHPRDSALCCFIRLTLDRYGELVTSLLYQNGFIHVVFYSESALLLDSLERHNTLLKSAFDSAGLRLSTLRVSLEREMKKAFLRGEGVDIKV